MNCVNAVRYCDTLQHIAKHHAIDSISTIDVTPFLHTNSSIESAASNNDIAAVLMFVARGADISSVKINDLMMCSNAYDIVMMLISTGKMSITKSDMRSLNETRVNVIQFLRDYPDQHRISISPGAAFLPPDLRHVDIMWYDLSEMMLRNIDAIKDLFRISQLWKEDGNIPTLFDMIEFEQNIEMWRRRIESLRLK